jgi:transposase
MKLSTLSLDHLGLVAGIFDELGISDVIDEAMSKTRDCKLQHSAIIKGLFINGLGFTERRMCIFPTYFKDLHWKSSLARASSPKISTKVLSAFDSRRRCAK